MISNALTARRAISWRRVATAAAAGAVVAALASPALGANVVKHGRDQGVPGYPYPAEGSGQGLGVFEAGTPADPPDATREVGRYDVEVIATNAAEQAFAGRFGAYAVTDTRYHTANGVSYPMVLQLAADAWAGEFLNEVPAQLEWLLRNAESLVAGEEDTVRAGAAIQVLVWQTLRNPQHDPPLVPRADLDRPTNDPAVNALAAKFRALMEENYLVGVAPPLTGTGLTGLAAVLGQADVQAAALELSLSAGPVVNCQSTITVTGTPGAVVVLTVTANGTVSRKTVVIPAGGTISVVATAATGTTVTVSGAISTGGVLVRADGVHALDALSPLAPHRDSRGPEELIFLAGAARVGASAPLTCPAPPGGGNPPGGNPPGGNPPGGTPPGGTPPPGSFSLTGPNGVSGTRSTPRARQGTLQVTKSGPRSAIAGQVVKYTLRVRNAGRIALRGVKLSDTLPAGMTVAGRLSGGSFSRGTITWNVGALAPGKSRTFSIDVRLSRSASARVCNAALASASNAARVRSSVCSDVARVAGVIQPAVTG